MSTIYREQAIDAIYEAFCYAYCDNCEKNLDEDLCGDCHRKYQNWSASKEIIKKVINALPSAEKTGKWTKIEYAEEVNGYLIPNYECSQCGYWSRENYNYCPECGTRMEAPNA